MPTIICDRCDKPLEVGSAEPGMKLTCPHCGDINVVRSAAGPVAPAATHPENDGRPEKLGLPPQSAEERVLLRTHPAMMRARPGLFFLLVLVASAGLVTGGILAAQGGRPVVMWASLVGAVVAMVWLGVWKVLKLGVALEVTNKRTILVKGLLSRATSEVLHDSIKNFQVTQSFVERVFQVGTIGISSSGQDDIEIIAKDMPRPYQIRKIIDAYRDM